MRMPLHIVMRIPKLRFRQNENNKIEITFTNSGDRIPGDMLQTIFEKFYRVDNSRSTEPEEQDLVLRLQKRLWNYMMDRS